MSYSLRHCAEQAKRHGELYFATLLPAHFIQEAFAKASVKWQSSIYTPSILVWCFLSQVLSEDHSCCDTVARLMAFLVAQGKKCCSPLTGAYCIARDKLPEIVCQYLFHSIAENAVQKMPESWHWHGRRVYVLDGTTITMADTPENQAEYPQPESQRPGCGFPIMRMIGVFCLATGIAMKIALGQYTGKQTGEASLSRSISDLFKFGDVVLGDRIFCGWFDVALLEQRGVDLVYRQHYSRKMDFRTGRKLGKDDHLVNWPKPLNKPEWMSQEEYDSFPDFIVMREVRVKIVTPGFRTREVIVVTTFDDNQHFTKEDIADMYRRRWQAELNLRSLKCVMQMEHLRCKEPHRVRNELYMHMIGYNLLRGVMIEAAVKAGVQPCQISFKGTLQTVNEFLRMLPCAVDVSAWCEALLICVAKHRVGKRPNRAEPRVRKRRPKNYPPMNRPRSTYRTRPAE